MWQSSALSCRRNYLAQLFRAKDGSINAGDEEAEGRGRIPRYSEDVKQSCLQILDSNTRYEKVDAVNVIENLVIMFGDVCH